MSEYRVVLFGLFLWSGMAFTGLAQAGGFQVERGIRYIFPRDSSVLDARRDLGAAGDGIQDDTDALQRGIDLSSERDGATCVLFIPNGVYRVTRTLVVRSAIGPWIYGESRDGVVIKLDDGVKDCSSVIRTHPNNEGGTSADWFMRNLRNFTIDVGNNPEVDGIRFFATNTGILKDVRVKGNGKVGVNAGFMGQSGPNLVQDVEIEGFETGLLSQWIWGETLSRVTIRNCRKQGVYVEANTVAIEDLVVQNTPIGLVCGLPNDWYWWGGVVALVNARFEGGDRSGPAMINRNVLYARNVRSRGFGRVLESNAPGGNVDGAEVTEYISHPGRSVFPSPERALGLRIRQAPVVPWEEDLNRWVCANEFGAKYGDNKDDTQAIQAAIDHAASQGKTTVYLRGVGGGDPNWYNLDGEVRVHGSVRRVMGTGFGRVLRGQEGRFVVDDRSAPVVEFRHFDAFGGPPVVIENRSKDRTLVFESGGVHIVGNGGGDIFVTDMSGPLELKKRGQKAWTRQHNPEGDHDVGLVQNRGGDLWALGVKCEGKGVRYLVSDRGRTEILGMFVYGPGIDANDERPIFDVRDGSLSVIGLREIAFDVPTYGVKLREKRGKETRLLKAGEEHPWIGWSMIGAWAGGSKP